MNIKTITWNSSVTTKTKWHDVQWCVELAHTGSHELTMCISQLPFNDASLKSAMLGELEHGNLKNATNEGLFFQRASLPAYHCIM